jgi:predicted dehydrogenase
MKVAIIGACGHVNLAVEAAEINPEIRIIAAAPGPAGEDISSFYRTHFQNETTRYYQNYLEMLADVKPEVAVVSPYFYLQTEVSLECLRRGIHVFVEKPVATSLKGLDTLRECLEKTGVQLMAMHTSRYSPPFFAAYNAVKRGSIGESLLLTVQKSYKLGRRPSFYRSRTMYGGTILWVGIHAIDLVYWFTAGQISEISAQHTTTGNHDHGELESSAACFYRLLNSGSATINIDYFRPETADTHGDDRLRVAGERGVVEVMNNEATLITPTESTHKLNCEKSEPMFNSFVRQIQGKEAMRISSFEVMDVTELAIKTLQAADTKRAIQFSSSNYGTK